MSKLIPGYWYVSSNLGDALTPWLVRKLGGEPYYVDINDDRKKLLSVGSILRHADANTVVWGAGIGEVTQKVDSRCSLRSVRGPLSYQRALDCGYEGPMVPFGDPAVLLSDLFWPEPGGEKIELGIVPHFVDQALVQPKYGGMDDVLVVDILRPVEEFVPQLLRCNRVVSSSLHGIVLALAYGIPCRWVEFSDLLAGDGVKFADFFGSCGLQQSPLNARELPSPKTLRTEIPVDEPSFDRSGLLESCPIRSWE